MYGHIKISPYEADRFSKSKINIFSKSFLKKYLRVFECFQMHFIFFYNFLSITNILIIFYDISILLIDFLNFFVFSLQIRVFFAFFKFIGSPFYEILIFSYCFYAQFFFVFSFLLIFCVVIEVKKYLKSNKDIIIFLN
ncbi:hypothetical protein RFI_13535 [Reticulomyxa filosa]|uniref:Uncharacterized protein n=1 Tax=Reticulomyxa filosa TaxID=46433 RepID=X6NBH4_RETFI|nr:hypothetical protein RFI_13535 [Reticulomyxa filosa]|eukprot:ETO23645.1 hypothetical protein RFI_13535 [Reticulomyxa filosa]